MDSRKLPIALALILPLDGSGKVSCQNSTVDRPVSRARAFLSKLYPFWLDFGYLVLEIKYTPKLVELIRYDNYGMIMTYVS